MPKAKSTKLGILTKEQRGCSSKPQENFEDMANLNAPFGFRPTEAPQNATEVLLTEHDLARAIGLSVTSVRRWRLRKIGPKATKLGSAIRYRPQDLKLWLDAQPTIGGEQQEAE